MTKRIKRLVVYPQFGKDSHIAGDVEVKGGKVMVLAVCGRLIEASRLNSLPLAQVSCSRCRSVSAQYNHDVGFKK